MSRSTPLPSANFLAQQPGCWNPERPYCRPGLLQRFFSAPVMSCRNAAGNRAPSPHGACTMTTITTATILAIDLGQVQVRGLPPPNGQGGTKVSGTASQFGSGYL